ncbi:hypothetical protein ABPG74_017730 [Tetrahymena malaccensis]
MSSSDMMIQEEEKQTFYVSQRGYSSDQADKLFKNRKKPASSDDSDCSSSDDELDDFYLGDNSDEINGGEGDFFQRNQNNQQIHRKDTKDLDAEAEMVNKKVNQTAKDKNENVDQKKKFFKNYIKLLVSKQKKRWESNGFSLDLTYITPRIIAMGFPAENYERWYRNSMIDVQNFFNKMHTNHYKVYNLCSERTYEKTRFPDVSYYPFEDHQAPEFSLIYRFCKDLFQYIHADKEGKNTAGVHCKAGKGRTGVMICCYLMYSGEYEKAIDALRYYGLMRTNNKKGVTIPSQIRYVQYFEKALHNKWKLDDFPQICKKITKIKLMTIPNFNLFGGCEPYFTITYSKLKKEKVEFKSLDKFKLQKYQKEAFIEYNLDDYEVYGDVQVQFYNKSLFKKKEKMFQFWFNCAFFEPNGVIVIEKNMLDTACKDKKNKKFSKEFHVEVHAIHPEQDTKIEFLQTSYLEQNRHFIAQLKQQQKSAIQNQ